MKIGDTLYHFDANRRRYTKPEPGRSYGELIYSEHFTPRKIVGETRISWLMEYNGKANKADPRKGGYFTAEQMADDIWVKHHRHQIRDLLGQASADHLREIARILGYQPA